MNYIKETNLDRFNPFNRETVKRRVDVSKPSEMDNNFF